MIVFEVKYKNHHDGIYITNCPHYDVHSRADLHEIYIEMLNASMYRFEDDWPVSINVVICEPGEGPSNEKLREMLQNKKN